MEDLDSVEEDVDEEEEDVDVLELVDEEGVVLEPLPPESPGEEADEEASELVIPRAL